MRAACGNKGYTPHSLRRGGATFFAEKGVPLPAIKRHGKWRSDAIELYLKRMTQKSSPNICILTGFIIFKYVRYR